MIVTPTGVQYGVATLSVTQRTGFLFGVRSCQDARIGITAIHVNTNTNSSKARRFEFFAFHTCTKLPTMAMLPSTDFKAVKKLPDDHWINSRMLMPLC